MASRWLLLLPFVLLLSCKKTPEESVNAPVLSVGESVDLRQVHFVDAQVGFACGGKRFEYGRIYKTSDGGATWSRFDGPDAASFYSIHFLNADTGYAGGEGIRLFVTRDGGDSWQRHWFAPDELPYHETNRTAIKCIRSIGSQLYLGGGENYETGIFYQGQTTLSNWAFDTLQHEVRNLELAGNRPVAAGYSYLALYDHFSAKLVQQDLLGDFFTGVAPLSDQSWLVCGNNGKLYRTTDAGQSWETVWNQGNGLGARKNFTDLVAIDAQRAIVVGFDGVVMKTTDGGSSWTQLDLGISDHLYDAFVLGSTVYVAGEGGNIHVLTF